MRYRTEDEIAAIILEVADTPQMRITRIMYETFLSHDEIKSILALLIEKGFVEYHKGDMTYKTTENVNTQTIHDKFTIVVCLLLLLFLFSLLY